VNQKKHAYSENEHKRAHEEPEIKMKIPCDSVKTPAHARRPLTGFKASASLRINVLE
jgi:hypothetical protein